MEINDIAKYWDKQASIWREEKDEAWELSETEYWKQYFEELLPTLSGNKVLEVGTASGYFANILALAGYDVTAVDLSASMIEEAGLVSRNLGTSVEYHVMDAQNLNFPNLSFDLIFTRLMTWTLPDVPAFYKKCFQLLKHDGTFINFDGDMGKVQFSQDGHERYPADIMEQANVIKSQLDVSAYSRPQKDVELLKEIGFKNVIADMTSQNKILHLPEDEPSLFELKAFKI